LIFSPLYFLFFLDINTNRYTTNNAVITNIASNPGNVDEVDVDEFSGCVVGVDAGAGIS
jgi:hypothetical protein